MILPLYNMAIPCGYTIDNGGLDTFRRGAWLGAVCPICPNDSSVHRSLILFFLRSPFAVLLSFLPFARFIRSPFAVRFLFSLSFFRRSPFAFLFAVPTRPTDRPTHPPHRMGGTAAAARRGRKRTGGPSCRHGAEVGFGVVAGVVRWVRVWGFGSILGKKQVNKEV